jgi:hypothetical protein
MGLLIAVGKGRAIHSGRYTKTICGRFGSDTAALHFDKSVKKIQPRFFALWLSCRDRYDASTVSFLIFFPMRLCRLPLGSIALWR